MVEGELTPLKGFPSPAVERLPGAWSSLQSHGCAQALANEMLGMGLLQYQAISGAQFLSIICLTAKVWEQRTRGNLLTGDPQQLKQSSSSSQGRSFYAQPPANVQIQMPEAILAEERAALNSQMAREKEAAELNQKSNSQQVADSARCHACTSIFVSFMRNACFHGYPESKRRLKDRPVWPGGG